LHVARSFLTRSWVLKYLTLGIKISGWQRAPHHSSALHFIQVRFFILFFPSEKLFFFLEDTEPQHFPIFPQTLLCLFSACFIFFPHALREGTRTATLELSV
jgi:hypothetical protein